jgi:uncharacterized FlgJ-related protein
MLKNTKTKIFDSVEDAINSVVMEVNKWQIFMRS